jgi:micrococcal nuclease
MRGAVEVSVTRVTDGDTVEVRPAVEGEEDVRFIGVDTPEKFGPGGPEPLAEEATGFTARSIEDAGGRVTLRFDVEEKDRYGRVLAYVYLPEGGMLNEDLVKEGYAQVATFPPNVRHREDFERAQESARDDRRGIWGLPPEDLCRLADWGNGIGGGC